MIGHPPAPRPQPPTTSGPRALPRLAEGWDQGWVTPNQASRLPWALSSFSQETITKATFCLLLTSEGRPFLPSTWETYSIDGKAQCPTSSQQPNIQPLEAITRQQAQFKDSCSWEPGLGG